MLNPQHLLGISSCTLYRMIKTGILPAQKIGHTWKISATDISICINQK
ncbi:MAG: helix-turn-helix domain-containing protein [Anaerovibrio lipolyticus]|nr:helix-turn-helix domain-containing protein [Anaerovibrio lipolyticus]